MYCETLRQRGHRAVQHLQRANLGLQSRMRRSYDTTESPPGVCVEMWSKKRRKGVHGATRPPVPQAHKPTPIRARLPLLDPILSASVAPQVKMDVAGVLGLMVSNPIMYLWEVQRGAGAVRTSHCNVSFRVSQVRRCRMPLVRFQRLAVCILLRWLIAPPPPFFCAKCMFVAILESTTLSFLFVFFSLFCKVESVSTATQRFPRQLSVQSVSSA